MLNPTQTRTGKMSTQLVLNILRLAAIVNKGRLTVPKPDEFLEKSQTVFAPPPPFSENHIAYFFRVLV